VCRAGFRVDKSVGGMKIENKFILKSLILKPLVIYKDILKFRSDEFQLHKVDRLGSTSVYLAFLGYKRNILEPIIWTLSRPYKN
jgi:hypothetical protein